MENIREQRIYCAEQIYVPEDLPNIMKKYSKAVIKSQPSDIIDFSLNYFTKEVNRIANEKESYPDIQEKPTQTLINKE